MQSNVILRRLGACTIGLLIFTACASRGHSAEAVARAFVDRFLVEANQRAALQLTEGPAREKVQAELRLLRGQPPSEAGERPRVFYRQLDAQTGEDDATFHFQLTVQAIGDQPVEPEVIVRVRRSADGWRVSNYEVLPPHTGSPAA